MQCYLTIPVDRASTYQITFEDILDGFVKEKKNMRDIHDTRTWHYIDMPRELIHKANLEKSIDVLKGFNSKHKMLIDEVNKQELYHKFYIPKKSGGLREINAPNEELMSALRELKNILEHQFYATYHTTAFAYVKGRSTIDAVKRHQANDSRWFLKLDAKDFFGSTTMEFVLNMFKQIFPFCYLLIYPEFETEFKKALSLCFLNGGLPQGTPISPILTNMMMIPIDHEISKMCREHNTRLLYTRYADDMLISGQYSFMWTEIQNKIVDILASFNANFSLNKEKTRYGSRSGRNWNLGVMLNKDGEITVGHQKKKYLKVMLYNFANDYKNEKPWALNDTQVLQGLISYYKMVEGENIDSIVKQYVDKTGVNIPDVISQIIKRGAKV